MIKYGVIPRLSVEAVPICWAGAPATSGGVVLIRVSGRPTTLLTEADAMAFTDEIRAIVFNRRRERA